MKQKVLLAVSYGFLIALPGVTLSFCPFDLPGEMLICSIIFFKLTPQYHNLFHWKVSKMQ